MVSKTIGHIGSILKGMLSGSIPVKPIFGICLGNQMLGMAAGGQTYKLPFGNRGQNQPVLNLLNNRCANPGSEPRLDPGLAIPPGSCSGSPGHYGRCQRAGGVVAADRTAGRHAERAMWRACYVARAICSESDM